MAADALAPYVARKSGLWYWLCRICRSLFTWGRMLSTCVISMWSNGIKWKYMFMFPRKNLARKELLFDALSARLLIKTSWTEANIHHAMRCRWLEKIRWGRFYPTCSNHLHSIFVAALIQACFFLCETLFLYLSAILCVMNSYLHASKNRAII